jgi:hypothetical protein
MSNADSLSISVARIGYSYLNTPPEITSNPMATPNPARAGRVVAFFVGVADLDVLDTLTVTWHFGDATSGTGATTTHTYAAPGTFAVKATVSDGQGGTDESSLDLTVDVAAVDMTLKKCAGTTLFTGSKDTATLQGTLPNVPAMDLTGKALEVDINGVSKQFTFADGRGKVKLADGTGSAQVKQTHKGKTVLAGPATVQVALKGSFNGAWKINDSLARKNYPYSVPVTVKLDATMYVATAQRKLTVTPHKKASFK